MLAVATVLACISLAGSARAQETGGSFGGGSFEEHGTHEHYHPSPSSSSSSRRGSSSSSSSSSWHAEPFHHDYASGSAHQATNFGPVPPSDWDIVKHQGHHAPVPGERAFLARADGPPPLGVLAWPWLGLLLGGSLPLVPVALARLLRRRDAS